MYAIADKYSIPLLKHLAQIRFTTVLKEIGDVKEFGIPNFVAAIDIIFNTTLSSDRGLRDAILPTLIRFQKELRNDEDFMGLIKAG